MQVGVTNLSQKYESISSSYSIPESDDNVTISNPRFTGIRWFNSSNYNIPITGGANGNTACRCGQTTAVAPCDATHAAFVANSLAGRSGWLSVSPGASIGINPFVVSNHASDDNGNMVMRAKWMPWTGVSAANGPDFSTGVGFTDLAGASATKNITSNDGLGAMIGIGGAGPTAPGKYTMQVSMARANSLATTYYACFDFEVVSGAGATTASAALVVLLAVLAALF